MKSLISNLQTKKSQIKKQHHHIYGKWSLLLTAMLLISLLAAGCSGSQVSSETAESNPTENTTASEKITTDQNSEEPTSEEGSDSSEDTTVTESDPVTVRVGAMSGPTAMGLVKLMDDAEQGSTANTYEFAELSTDPSAFV
ncbi:MAG: hypothetical protein IJ079_02870, partial [Lachnospiraceae bacterium]|nr:hypothetical protein [Lachnospiraceae bacterium]MBR1568977.1 hypothetical protein [Lachnospiraceae bacterium]